MSGIDWHKVAGKEKPANVVPKPVSPQEQRARGRVDTIKTNVASPLRPQDITKRTLLGG